MSRCESLRRRGGILPYATAGILALCLVVASPSIETLWMSIRLEDGFRAVVYPAIKRLPFRLLRLSSLKCLEHAPTLLAGLVPTLFVGWTKPGIALRWAIFFSLASFVGWTLMIRPATLGEWRILFYMGWGPILLPTPLALILSCFRRKGETKDAPLCPRCGYSLRGNTSGVCPECGTTVGFIRGH